MKLYLVIIAILVIIFSLAVYFIFSFTSRFSLLYFDKGDSSSFTISSHSLKTTCINEGEEKAKSDLSSNKLEKAYFFCSPNCNKRKVEDYKNCGEGIFGICTQEGCTQHKMNGAGLFK